ncbi:MAG: DinB family protein [Anaerolineae bacterium]|jgi:uncharacterized damage-inducible protein DinB|nr:DinB family protein [Anaerolineae bacterium]
MVSERIAKHLDRLHKARARLDAALDTLPPEREEERLYSDGAQWTLRQLVIHLMIADRGHNSMIQGIATGQPIIPPDYDLERFNKRSVEKQAAVTLAQARDALRASRQELIDWLHGLEDDAVLDLEGRHASLQIMSISRILNVMAWHEDTHTGDIEKHLTT